MPTDMIVPIASTILFSAVAFYFRHLFKSIQVDNDGKIRMAEQSKDIEFLKNEKTEIKNKLESIEKKIDENRIELEHKFEKVLERISDIANVTRHI